MRVAGCDYSSKFVDVVTVPYDTTGQPVWHRFPLAGADAFDRARSVAEAVPGRSSVFWDDILCVGIEHPGGRFGTGDMLRVQGAILARIPARMLVHPLPPARWRKLVGIPGNAPKIESRIRIWELDPTFISGLTGPDGPPPLDATDAYCIALATRTLITTEKAA